MNAPELLAAVRQRRTATVGDAGMALALLPVSELANRRQLAALAAPALADPTVAAAWLGAAAAETDSGLRDELIGQLLALRPGQLPAEALPAWVDLLVGSLQREELRHGAIGALRSVVAAVPGLADRLVAAAREATDRQVRDHLDDILLDLAAPTAAVAEHLRNRLAGCGPAVRARLVAILLNRGLLPDAAAGPLLAPSEPVEVRSLVLQHWLGRSAGLTSAVAQTLRADPDPGCRLLALRLLTSRPGDAEAVAAVLHAMRHDPEPWLRTRAIAAGAGWSGLAAGDLRPVLDALRGERDRNAFTALVGHLGGQLARVPELRLELLALLKPELGHEAATAICTVLAPWARSDAALRGALLDAYEGLAHDRVREAMLAAMAGILQPDAALEATFQRALRSAAPGLRSWGARGFLRLDTLTLSEACIAAAADHLATLSPGGNWEQNQLREQLLRKLAVIRPLPAAIRMIADHEDDDLRELAGQAVQNAVAAVGAGAEPIFDWAAALEKVAVRHDTTGVFPEALAVIGQDRAAAGRLVHATALALLTDSLVSIYPRPQVTLAGLVPYLVELGVLDEPIVRTLALRLRARADSPDDVNGDLAVLQAHPRCPEVLPTVAALLTRRGRLNPELLHRLVLAAVGGEDAAMVAWFHGQLLAINDPATAEQLLGLLEKGEEWIVPDPVLLGWHGGLAQKPGSERLLRAITDLAKRWKLELPGTPAAATPPRRPEQTGGILDD